MSAAAKPTLQTLTTAARLTSSALTTTSRSHGTTVGKALAGNNNVSNIAIQTRGFSKGGSGGFQGPTSRGMGRDGGGRGPGGPHRTPRGGAGRGGGAETASKGGAFAELRARRAALERDLEAAREATQSAAGAGRGGRGPPRPHHTRKHPPRQYPHQHSSDDQPSGRPGRAPHRGGERKLNFAETVLRPAAEGRLASDAASAIGAGGGADKHSSGIPKLLARKYKGHAVHDAEQLVSAAPSGTRRSARANVRGEMRGVVMGDLEREDRMYDGGSGRERAGGRFVKGRMSPFRNRQRDIGATSSRFDQKEEMWKANNIARLEYFAKDADGYDSDEDLEPIVSEDDEDYMDLDNHELIKKQGNDFIVNIDLGEGESQDRRGRLPPYEPPMGYDPQADTIEYQYLFRDLVDVDHPILDMPSKPKSEAILPLRGSGPSLGDFLQATMDHPSKYSLVQRVNKHPDSKREARPTFPRDRKLPSEDFVNKYKGFLFVSGLVPHLDEKTGDVLEFDDPLHQQSISEAAAKVFGVTTLDVSPATPTSAFVGFATKNDAKEALINALNDCMVTHPTELSAFDGLDEEKMTDEQKEFVSSAGDTNHVLKVTGVPVEVTSVEVIRAMFPPGSKLEAMFGPFTRSDYLRLSPTTLLINLGSSDLVSKALKSTNIANNAALVGKRNLQMMRAKRERVFDGWSGPNRAFAKSKLGKRLFVHGDIPPEDLFLSHHDVLHIAGLPPSVTLRDLATFFQPFCADQRDVVGSGHIVRCARGVPTGCAYIGFELPGELDQVKEMYNGKAIISEAPVTLRPVWDKELRRGVRQGARSERSLEELDDDLNNWERHVDPKDIKELEDLGVEKSILDEVMRTLRHHNRTFSSIDQAMPGERLYPERRVGTHYRDFVKKYIKILKSCVATRENPGLMYEAMFSPDQDVELGLFDIEEKRIAELRKKGI